MAIEADRRVSPRGGHPRADRRLPFHPASAHRSFPTSRCCPPATLNKIRVQGIIVDDRTVLRRQKHVPARNGRIRQRFMPRCKIQPRHENGFTVYSLVGSKSCIMTFRTTPTIRKYSLNIKNKRQSLYLLFKMTSIFKI